VDAAESGTGELTAWPAFRRIVLPTLAACFTLPALALPSLAAPLPTREKPKLVLQITVDQFRGDLPRRYFDRLGKGGLRYLLEEGIH